MKKNDLLSQSFDYYKTPRTITIANMKYKNVSSIDSKRFVDGDNVIKTINDIDAADGRYVCIANDKKVEYSSKHYYNPVSRTLGGKTYNGIQYNYIRRDGSKIYEIYNNGFYNKVKVSSEGKVYDYNAMQREALKKALLKPFKMIGKLGAKLAHCIR